MGPITEGDLTNAASTGAVILGFDVPCNPMVMKSAESHGVSIHQHKLIYKYVEDVEHYVHDVRREILEEDGIAVNIEILGSAQIAQIFKVKDPRSKTTKMIPVAGSRVTQGEIERKYKYRILRGDKVLQDNLKIYSMKKLQTDVTKVEKGQECGLAFDNFEGDLQPGDLIECYKDAEAKITKFNMKPGVHQSY